MKRIFSLCILGIMLASCTPIDQPTSESGIMPEYDSYILYHAENVSLSELDDITGIIDHRARYVCPDIQNSFSVDRDNYDVRMDFVYEEGWAEEFLQSSVMPDIVAFRKGTDPGSETLLGNRDISSVSTECNIWGGGDSEVAVLIELTDTGAEKFAKITGELAGTDIPLSIWLDDEMLSSPKVAASIVDGKAVITGNFTQETADELSNKMMIGELPYKLTVKEHSFAGSKG